MKQPKYKIIAQKLKESIDQGSLAPGDKVPSVADLRCQYAVSHITVMSAYQILADSNYIENHAGRGYFVKKRGELRRDASHNVIGLGIRPLWKYNPSDYYFNEVTYGIQQTCIKHRYSWLQHYSTQILGNPFFDSQNAAEVKNIFLKMADHVDGFLVDERIPDDLIQKIYDEVRCPMVLVNRRTKLDFLDCVYPPLGEALVDALEFALKLEYENFIFCVSDHPQPGSLNEILREGFASFLEKKHIPSERIVVISGCNFNPHEETFSTTLRKKKGMPKGKTLFITDVALYLYPYLLKMGLRPGSDCGLFSVYDISAIREHVPQITALQMKPIEIGEIAVNVLLQRLYGTGEPCRAHMPKPEMLIGKTL